MMGIKIIKVMDLKKNLKINKRKTKFNLNRLMNLRYSKQNKIKKVV